MGKRRGRASTSKAPGAPADVAAVRPIPLLAATPEPAARVRVVAAHHGREYRFCPSQTALLVIDMQKHFFVDDDGNYIPELAAVVPKVVELVAFARSLGCLVVHTRESYCEDQSDVTPYRDHLGYVGRENSLGRFLIRGEPGCDFIDEVCPLADEPVIDKAAFNAFFASTLGDRLHEAGISHLILCGVTTQCCVHSTLREAVDRGYWCLTVADCCGAYDAQIHEATLAIIAGEGHLFGWLCDLADLRASEVAVD
jgi:biuret amidohydrolase